MDVSSFFVGLIIFPFRYTSQIHTIFHRPQRLHSGIKKKSCPRFVLFAYLGVGVDVGQVSGNTGGVDNVVKGKVGDQGGLLEQERQRLSDTAGSTENSDP